tara:strand:- start:113 stop:364 length:252 start_codon:yes stop_codon:yes gene_type:complete
MDVLVAGIFGLTLGLGIAAQGYFMYKSLRLLAVLKAAPDVPSAKSMLGLVGEKKKEKPQEPTPAQVNPSELSEEALSNIRKKQ